MSGAADRRRVAAELALPETVAEDRPPARRSRGTSSAAVRSAADGAADAERVEELAAHPERHATGRASPLVVEVERRRRPTRHSREKACWRSRICCHSGLVSCGARPVNCRCVPARASSMRTSTSCSRLLDRQRPQAHGVEQLKDRGVRADAERQREDRDDGERRVAPKQAARRSVRSRQSAVEEVDGVHVVDLLADAGGVAELATRGVARVAGRHAARDVVVGFDGEVRVELARPLGIPRGCGGRSGCQLMIVRCARPRRLENPVDRLREGLPAGGLLRQLPPAERRQRVVARAAVVFGRAPHGRDPAAILEPVERGIERSMLDLQDVIRASARSRRRSRARARGRRPAS